MLCKVITQCINHSTTDVGNLFTTIDKMQSNDQDVLKLLYDSLQKNPLQSLQPNQLVRLISGITQAGLKVVRTNLEMSGH